MDRAQLLWNFGLAQQRLEQAKKTELRWRMLVAATFKNLIIGTNTSDDGAVKMVIRETVSVDKDVNKVASLVSQVQRQFPNLPIEGGVFKWSVDLQPSEFNALPDDVKLALSPIITIKQGLPSVTLT